MDSPCEQRRRCDHGEEREWPERGPLRGRDAGRVHSSFATRGGAPRCCAVARALWTYGADRGRDVGTTDELLHRGPVRADRMPRLALRVVAACAAPCVDACSKGDDGAPVHRERHPRAPRPAPVEPVALACGDRPRDHVAARRARGDTGWCRRHRPARAGYALPDGGADRRGRERLPRGCGARRALLRATHRHARAEEALLRDARGLSRRVVAHGVLDRLRVVCRLPLLHRCRHRRRVLRDQRGDRRAASRAGPWPSRPRDQRHVLARRRPRSARHASSSSIRTSCRSGSGGASASASGRPSGSSFSLRGSICPRARDGSSCTGTSRRQSAW